MLSPEELIANAAYRRFDCKTTTKEPTIHKTIPGCYGMFGQYTVQTPHFIKLTDTTFGEIIINTSAITFINPGTGDICVTNTDGESGGGMLRITKESMTKLLHKLDLE